MRKRYARSVRERMPVVRQTLFRRAKECGIVPRHLGPPAGHRGQRGMMDRIDAMKVFVARRPDRAGGGNHPVIAVAIGLDQSGANALRCACNHCNFLFRTHHKLLSVLRVVKRGSGAALNRLPATTLVRGASEWPLFGRHSFAARKNAE